jgi:hypothetical protein
MSFIIVADALKKQQSLQPAPAATPVSDNKPIANLGATRTKESEKAIIPHHRMRLAA